MEYQLPEAEASMVRHSCIGLSFFPVSNPLLGIFSLPGVLCLILGALLFLVLIILVTQLLRWRAERRGGMQGELGTREGVWRREMGQV